MKSDVNFKLLNYFDSICKKAVLEALAPQELYLQNLGLKGLKPIEKVIKLEHELNLINQQILHFKRRDYFNLIDDPNNLKNYFFARLVFYSQEENMHLRAAFILKEKFRLITRLLIEAKAKLTASKPPECGETKNQLPVNWHLYETILHQANQLGHAQGQRIIAGFKESLPLHDMTEKQYRSILSGQLKKLNIQFNALEDPKFYYLLKEPLSLTRYFAEKYCQGIDINCFALELQKVVSLEAMNAFLTNELLSMDENVVEKALDHITCQQTPPDILYRLVPEPESIEKLNALVCKIEKDLAIGKPVLLIKKDKKKVFEEIFLPSFANFQDLLNKLPVDRKYIYIKYMRKDLATKKNRAKKQGKVFCHYYDQLIDLFEDEWRYVDSVEIKDPITIEDVLYERRLPQKLHEPQKSIRTRQDTNKLLAFYYNNIKKDGLPLVHKRLLQLKAIPPETTLTELRAIVNGLELVKPLKWLAGQGDLMVFIKEATSNGKLTFPYQQQWNIAVKCFVKEDGSSFDVTGLKLARPTNMAAKFIRAAKAF
ncbi:MAG TPA: hypothetical protein VGK10_00800 [Prolixibacteraceae bacterium]|jgi:hypothetical protein